MMQDSVRKATPLALALVLALSGAALAGDNADATFSLVSPTVFANVGPGGEVSVEIEGSGLVGVKQFDIAA